jgi:hypothetical protein
MVSHCTCPTRAYGFLLCNTASSRSRKLPDCPHCAHRATVINLINPSKLAWFSLFEGHPCWSKCGRRTRLQMIPPSSLVTFQGWGLIDLPLRASNEGLPRTRVARAQKIIRLHPLLCSASKKDGLADPYPPFPALTIVAIQPREASIVVGAEASTKLNDYIT